MSTQTSRSWGISLTSAVRNDGLLHVGACTFIVIGVLFALGCTSPPQENVTGVACGENHNLELRSDGTVWSWRRNKFGQLGNGSTSDTGLPGQVQDLTGTTAIACGNAHCLAVRNDHTAWSWGNNFYGQLGNGKTGSSHVPVKVNWP